MEMSLGSQEGPEALFPHTILTAFIPRPPEERCSQEMVAVTFISDPREQGPGE